jgi:hypothetical protein
MDKEDGGRAEKAGRGMSRGEFLAVGGAGVVGAGLGVGCEAASPQEAPTVGDSTEEEPTNPCVRRECADSPEWEIPASHLNTLWSHVLPRLVAIAWREGTSIRDWQERQLAEATSVDLSNRRWSVDVKSDPQRGTDSLQKECDGSWAFLTRVSALNSYLARGDAMPIRIMGEGGFDFILSPQGLDIFIPDKPEKRRDLVHYYTFRRTGRRSIGIPKYMDCDVSGIQTDSPTGPSAIWMNYDSVVELVERHSADDECKAAVVRCLDTHLSREGRAGQLQVRLAPQTFMCIMEGLRCWQLSGAVYRGIMTELPRIVANIWLERIDGVDGANNSYATRFESSDKCREIFEERLETSLPPLMEMRIDDPVSQAAAPLDSVSIAEPLPSGRLDPATNRDLVPDSLSLVSITPQCSSFDVRITNNGVFLPQLDNGVPTESEVYAAMMNGTAGNPVFTDSQRTQ